MTNPLVSICIPTYNAEKTVGATLDTVLKQRYRNLEIWIVDNASSDGTLEAVAEFDDPRIKIQRNKTNVGGEGNFNRCIQMATGKYTAIFHADDQYESDMVEKQVAFLEANPQAGVVFTGASLIDDEERCIGRIAPPKELDSPTHLYDFATILRAVLRNSNFLICPSAMARTDVYQQEIVRWRGELFKSSADLDVWLRIAQRHPVGLLPQPLMRYRISKGQFSAGVRQRIGRADFFLVTDHYLQQKDVRSILDRRDIESYMRLDRRDRVMRATNAMLAGQPGEIQGLLHDLYSWSSLKAAWQTGRGLGVLVAGSYLRLLNAFGLNKFAQVSLGFLKRAMRK